MVFSPLFRGGLIRDQNTTTSNQGDKKEEARILLWQQLISLMEPTSDTYLSHDEMTVKGTIEIHFLGGTRKQFIKANDRGLPFLVC